MRRTALPLALATLILAACTSTTPTTLSDTATPTSTAGEGSCDAHALLATVEGMSEDGAVISYCDGHWAKVGQYGTEDYAYPYWDGTAWVLLTPAGQQESMGRTRPCYSGEDLAAHAPIPSAITLPECLPGEYF